MTGGSPLERTRANKWGDRAEFLETFVPLFDGWTCTLEYNDIHRRTCHVLFVPSLFSTSRKKKKTVQATHLVSIVKPEHGIRKLEIPSPPRDRPQKFARYASRLPPLQCPALQLALGPRQLLPAFLLQTPLLHPTRHLCTFLRVALSTPLAVTHPSLLLRALLPRYPRRRFARQILFQPRQPRAVLLLCLSRCLLIRNCRATSSRLFAIWVLEGGGGYAGHLGRLGKVAGAGRREGHRLEGCVDGEIFET
ncbi:hypothetical protein BGW80DRAFT_752839 [Lactifluus volemus]|nr:hypothetical protein BGW80DRAFT_752839 [Lactifluus volemus]